LIKKNFLKLISNTLIKIGGLISVIIIILISICIYIIINKSITINDNNKFISKIISWYYDTSVSFDYIEIGNLNKYKNITIEINELKIDNYKNYKVIQAENLKYNINYNGLTKYKYYITNVELLNPIVIYETNSKKNNNTIVKKLNNFLGNIEDIVIYNGKVVYSNLDNKYYLSHINIIKKGFNDLDILGNFLYRDNNSYVEDKKFSFKSKKIINSYKINLNFTELTLPKLILNILNLNSSYTISGLFSGEAIITIRNNKIINTELKMHSKDSIIKLKENLDYNKFSFVNIPNFNKVSLSLFYDFNKSLLNINNLTFDIKNNLNIKSEIILSAEKLLKTDLYKINYIFNNVYIKDFIKIYDYRLSLILENLFTGSGNIALINNSINNINLIIDSFSNKEVFFKDIHVSFNKNTDNADIFFTLDSDYLSFINFIKKSNITSYDFSYFKHKKYRNILNSLNFKIQFSNLSQSFDNYIIDIKGNLSKQNSDIFYIKDFLYIKNINYLVNIDKDKIYLSGSALVNNIDINFNLKKFDEFKINFNFDLNEQFFINNNLNKKFKGFTSTTCSINSKIEIWFYICDVNFTKNTITIPSLGLNKKLGERAYLNLNGIINSDFLLEENNFTYIHHDNLFKGNYKFDNINNNYYVNFNKFIYNKNELVLALLFKNNSIDIDITSGILDLTPFLIINNNIQNNLIPSITLNANLNKIIIFDNIELGPTKISSTNIYNNLILESSYNSSEKVSLNINSNNNNNILAYNFKASNAGKFFNLFDYKTEIKDGVLASQGFIGDLDNNNDIIGTISIDKFKIMKTPLFAELLLAASFTGLFDLLNNEGIAFDQFDAQFTKKKNIFNINKSRAYGFSLGLTGEGLINNLDKTLDINGSIVPAYKLNTMFNNIPLIGEILSGNEDEGIFAINYTAKGGWKNLDIVVNPLSLLTPGIIRNIFD
jgi:hypothetical protein